jgi:hypothetical protein
MQYNMQKRENLIKNPIENTNQRAFKRKNIEENHSHVINFHDESKKMKK